MIMAERITITLPGDIYKRLQVVKGNLNISGLCQGVIKQAIQIEEIKMKDIPIEEKVIERLRLEKQIAERERKKTGFIDGQEDAQELTYEDFMALSKQGISEKIREWVQDKRIRFLEDTDEEIYLEGWVEGALHFWKAVKTRL
jgi:predicted CopG family antitoxin